MSFDVEHRYVRVGPHGLPGALYLPRNPLALVIFAHGSGSSRSSPRNIFVAEELVGRGFACLLFDLLRPAEAQDRSNVFDIPLLTARVREAIGWSAAQTEIGDLPVGLFGASTGAAAALSAAAQEPEIGAVVSRGGRPDLAGMALARVRAPTLLLVGGDDRDVLELNREALSLMSCEARLEIVPGATHLFEEPGALEDVVSKAGDWFVTHLTKRR
jgi:pimeloyl-ACP methyl ester carboxylesterase